MKNSINKLSQIALKSLVALVMLALTFMGVFSAPLMSVAQTLAATNYNNHIASGLKLKKLPNSAKLKNAVDIPFGETDNSGDVVNVKILDPKGTIVFDNLADDLDVYKTVAVDSSNKVYKLTPDKVGTYKVQYSVTSGAGLQNLDVQEYKIVVSGNKATMKFEENSKYMIPSVVSDEHTIVLPNPTVVDSEGNDVASDKVLENLEIIVKENSQSNKTYSSDAANEEGNIIKNAEGHYSFTPNATEDCIYTISYIYTDILTGLETTEVFEVKYEKEFDASNIKLGYKFVGGNIPKSMELGVETTLPTISVYDENDSEFVLAGYTDVLVQFLPNEANLSKYDNQKAITVSTSNVVTPMYPSTEGTYKITYTIADFYNYESNNTEKYTTLEYSISDVKDSTAPVTYAVADYSDALIFDQTDTTKVIGIKDDFDPIDLSYKIPTKVATNTEVYLPAIFATDNFTKYENMLSTFARVIVPETGSNTTVTTCYKDVSGEMKTVSVKPYETASYKFTKPGTYTIRYEATDEANKYNYRGLNFTIVVEDGFVDEVAPSITLSGIPATSKYGETISFNKATIVDYKVADATNTEVIDKNLEIYYYYYTEISTSSSLEAELNKARNGEPSSLTEIKVDEKTGKLSFVAPETSATVVCVAYDDAGNRAIEERTVSIVNINDNNLPTISTDDEDYVDAILTQNLSQDEIITLPEFVVSDDNFKYLEGTVSVKDDNGNKISVTGAKYTLNEDDGEMTISNAKFVATKSGAYTINYTINDIGGNYVIKSYIVSIADTKTPSIELDSSITTVEIGETVKLPSITVKDNGVVLNNPTTEVRFVGENPSYKFNNGTLEFVALEEGTFTFEYYAKDGAGNDTISGPYTIKAQDTIKPVITLDRNLNADKTHAIEKDNNENILPIVIPGFTAEDTLNGIAESRVEVEAPSGKTLTVTETAEGFSFVPTVDGIYTINYIAVDNAKNETIESYTLRIGDNIAPSIVIDSLDLNAPEELKVKSTLDLDLTKIFVSDAGTTKTADELTTEYTNNGYRMFTVSVTGPNGATVKVDDGAEYEYTLTETGKYTITYTARDEAGNEKIIKKYVEVYADDNNSVISNETWSIVLIVASLAILAGVVIYFVKTRDKKPTAKKLNPKDDDKKLD